MKGKQGCVSRGFINADRKVAETDISVILAWGGAEGTEKGRRRREKGGRGERRREKAENGREKGDKRGGRDGERRAEEKMGREKGEKIEGEGRKNRGRTRTPVSPSYFS